MAQPASPALFAPRYSGRSCGGSPLPCPPRPRRRPRPGHIPPRETRRSPVDADVVIAGAGPTGLMLACELHLAGVRSIVLERLAEPTGLSKALALVGRSVDTLDYRGLPGRF